MKISLFLDILPIVFWEHYFCDQKVGLQKMDFEIIFENTRKSRALHPLSPISAPGVGNSFCCLVHQQITNTFVRLKQ